ncbi:hypothetical protein V9T40_013220 [Parthenolecanium corni]|uniref:Uncharacterized protein n=1 Tax=Parthenolecanium corni TaxID=536013 RepID=A0AAN9Y6Z5_9HEMI
MRATFAFRGGCDARLLPAFAEPKKLLIEFAHSYLLAIIRSYPFLLSHLRTVLIDGDARRPFDGWPRFASGSSSSFRTRFQRCDGGLAYVSSVAAAGSFVLALLSLRDVHVDCG